MGDAWTGCSLVIKMDVVCSIGFHPLTSTQTVHSTLCEFARKLTDLFSAYDQILSEERK